MRIDGNVSTTVESGTPNPVDHPENLASLGQEEETSPGPSVKNFSLLKVNNHGNMPSSI